jgi:hypothetical protein
MAQLYEKNKIIFAIKLWGTASFKRARSARLHRENRDLLKFSTINFWGRPPLPATTAV